jgi:exopolyphosphatase/guanosine-5'-triphosphate,3'-diphosphate pyrophosphatase
MKAGEVYILATSAVRDASNSDAFVNAVEATMNAPVHVLSGEQEAHYAALGVVAGIPDFTGIVGDLGGGSLELSSMASGHDAVGETHGLGVIRLQDDSGRSASRAREIARERLARSALLRGKPGGQFCAIGGTWRSLAKIHQVLRDYPLHMVQHYVTKASDLAKLCDEIVDAFAAGKAYPGSDHTSSSRRDLVPFGAVVLSEVLRAGKFDSVLFSAQGVREGYLLERLSPEERAVDPLLQGAEEISILRSRSPAHADDLIEFTGDFLTAIHVKETPEEERLRKVACYLSDIGWRGHPDYRGEQSVDMVAYGSLAGVDHPGRAFLAEALAVRYMGLKHKSMSQDLMALSGAAANMKARLLGATFRVAYPMSAAMPGVLPRAHFSLDGNRLRLHLPEDLAFLAGEHLAGRLEQLAGVAGIKASEIVPN